MMKLLLIPFLSLLLINCNATQNTLQLNNNCFLEPNPGRCRAYIPKYYFNQNKQSCEQFIWGGCGGVVPFDNMSQCQQMCPSSKTDSPFQLLENSRLKWQKAMHLNNHNYQYSINFSSWVGFGSNTTIYVSNNTIVKRDYQSWDQDRQNVANWTEEDSLLGKHKEGADLLTMEQLYQQCHSILLNKKDSRLHFIIDDNGYLKQCLSSPKNCADDCSSGVNIQSLTLNQPLI